MKLLDTKVQLNAGGGGCCLNLSNHDAQKTAAPPSLSSCWSVLTRCSMSFFLAHLQLATVCPQTGTL